MGKENKEALQISSSSLNTSTSRPLKFFFSLAVHFAKNYKEFLQFLSGLLGELTGSPTEFLAKSKIRYGWVRLAASHRP
jgi:hypothetical protein